MIFRNFPKLSKTFIGEIDNEFRGLYVGEITVIVGNAKSGRSRLAQLITAGFCFQNTNEQFKILYISREESRAAISRNIFDNVCDFKEIYGDDDPEDKHRYKTIDIFYSADINKDSFLGIVKNEFKNPEKDKVLVIDDDILGRTLIENNEFKKFVKDNDIICVLTIQKRYNEIFDFEKYPYIKFIEP